MDFKIDFMDFQEVCRDDDGVPLVLEDDLLKIILSDAKGFLNKRSI